MRSELIVVLSFVYECTYFYLMSFFYVDESGDPNFLGRGKKDLLATGSASKWFIVGYLEATDPGAINRRFADIRVEIQNDDYINTIPSVRHSMRCFHANKDCREVQERVFKALHACEFSFHAVVLEKKIDQFISKFHGKRSVLYSYMVERLMENRLHIHPEIDIYFAKLDSVINEENMWGALENAKDRFYKKWNKKNQSHIRIFLQQPHQIAGLQAVDYCLWAIHRAYNYQDFRYYNYLQSKISLIHDLSYGKEYYGSYFSRKNPLNQSRFT